MEGWLDGWMAWKQNQSIEQRSLWAQDRLRRNSGGVLRGDAKSYECGHAVVDTLSMDGLEGPEEVKEVLRLISRPEHEAEEDEEEGVEANLMSASEYLEKCFSVGGAYEFVATCMAKAAHGKADKPFEVSVVHEESDLPAAVSGTAGGCHAPAVGKEPGAQVPVPSVL
ncbi:hypothetical protein AK812_SmicGene19536 [Symbiodinium microadriaticum]|uniref:Uncharacterized protein n=1 Tax=Symbiodinium microadriaticum TaxID=2951 RepID=A0A1Q9DS92_SYMMI|nr:hypothetical protein AK812_SmicGene19536 [Symbiodinium microadriaticum]